MTNKKKQLETLIFSFAGIAIMLVILIGFYLIVTAAPARVDLTNEKLFTLSPGTRKILAQLDTPVQFRFYSTQGKEMPVEYKTYAQRVEDLLKEYQKAAKGKIELKKFDPQPDSDAEDSANLDGIQGQSVGFDRIYLGLAISMLDAKVALPVLTPERERLLEYDLSRAIARVIHPEKPVIGVMSGLPVFGAFNPMMMRMGQGRQDPWVFIQELKNDFDVRELQLDAEQIESEIKVLVVIHPKGITDKGQYALDQFVLRGGKLIAFLDPHSFVDSRNSPQNQNNPLQATANSGSTLDKLLKGWGLEFEQNRVVADKNYVSQIGGRGGQPQRTPTVLSLTKEALNQNDVVTAEVGSLLLPYAGVFTGTPLPGIKQEILLKTSANSHLVEKMLAEMAPDQDFVPSGKEYALAIRLTGKFKSAFPDGKPKDATPPPPAPGEENKDEAKSDAAGLKEASAEGVAILVGDADMLYDAVFARIQELFGQRMIIPFNGNLTFAQNMVEQLAGDSNLISVRSRATMNRPFTVVRKMQAEAEERFRSKIKDLEKDVNDTQTRLSELQRGKETGQQFILSAEQQAEIERFRKKQVDARKELKVVRRNLRKEIDSLENRLKWSNIVAMPFVVSLTGIGLAMLKRKRTAAK